MPRAKIFSKSYIFYILIITTFGAAFFRSIDNKGIWLDEAGQFWMTLGLNHFSLPFSETGGIREMYINNIERNMDPGGFALIQRIWISFFGTSIISLRLFPFIVFVLSAVIVFLISVKLRINMYIALLSPLFLVASPLLHQYAFEIRPYSMESMAWLAILLLTLSLKEINKSNPSILIFIGCILSVFLTQRYSVIVAIASFFFVFILFIVRQSKGSLLSLRNYFKSFILIALPVIVTSIVLFVKVLKYQNPAGESPFYVQSIMLSHANDITFLLDIKKLAVWGPFLLLIILTMINKYFKLSIFENTYKQLLNIYLLFSFSSVFMLFVLSCLGKYPISFYSRWDIGVNSILIPVYIIFIDLIYNAFNKKSSNLSYCFSIVCASLLSIISFVNKHESPNSLYSDLKSCISEKQLSSSRILAYKNSSPSLRYLFEYGPLKTYTQTYKSIKWFTSDDNSNYSEKSIKSLPIDDVNFIDYDIILISHFDISNNSNASKLIEIGKTHNLCSSNKKSYVFAKIQ